VISDKKASILIPQKPSLDLQNGIELKLLTHETIQKNNYAF